ncbi:MAG: [FeFe] hydrogenase H-cluster maturation GTPase HydF [Oscillospiraceae bacterium]|nr:[FeFe] hydrogenase H-cluster maturation GTPase HydF [Oscillospiraceae bacterium]
MSLTNTPSANRLHIGLYGKRNSGKSSLINAITGQHVALVSDVAGTTTDPVQKAMEIHGIGPCMLVDTAGFDDTDGQLGAMRVEKTKQSLQKMDVALLLFDGPELSEEKAWLSELTKRKTAVVGVINKADLRGPEEVETLSQKAEVMVGERPIVVSAKTGEGIEALKQAIIRAVPEDFGQKTITGALVSPEDVVLLVMPQDIQAPKGRLILPQVQTIRDLLDHHCVVLCTTADQLDSALNALAKPPALIITDSQVFPLVYEKKPKESRLTSFSVLFAAYKGDLQEFVDGANAIEALNDQSKVLIAEACTHAPLEEDIGRVKIPNLLRKRYGSKMQIDIVSGADFPVDLTSYDLIIHCGACMFNQKHVLSRIAQAKSQGTAITNYGVALAKLAGILDKVDLGPEARCNAMEPKTTKK